MIYPEFLKSGDCIGVTAPSAGSENELDIKRIEMATKKMRQLGYRIKETKNCRQDDGKGRSSDKKERAKEFNELFEDKEVKAIIGLSGGEFLVEMLSNVDFDVIKNNPKWVQGFSDITGLLFPITTNLDIATIYGNNFRSFSMKDFHPSIKYNLEILKGNMICQESFDMYESQRSEKEVGDESYNLDEKVNWINLNNEKEIQLRGRIIGGCLDLIMCLIGTKYDKTKEFIEKYKDDGIVWYFDNCELSSEAIIRAMWQLNEAGYFKYTKGIVFGRSAMNKSYYNITFAEAVRTSLKELNVPIIIDADIGHKPPQMTIINGAIAEIYSAEGKGKIKFEFKE